MEMQYRDLNRMNDKGGEVGSVDGGLESSVKIEVDFRRNRFPCAVVWQPFPPLTWFIPMIGHTGITDSHGVVHDFQGPFTVIEDSMMLGRACRYLPLDPSKVFAPVEGSTPEERWDKCIEQGCNDYRKKIHCLLYPNCNHHVAHCLNCLKYGGWSYYEMFQLWFMIFFRARFCGWYGFLMGMGPFIIFCISVVIYFVVPHS